MSARRLRDACERGDLDVVNDEIARGADVNDAVGASWTALHRAAERGRVQIVRALLNAGAEVGAETKTGGT
jgi:ankyrin repeat protein